MARLQILELPEGSSDDRPPFVLVIDQCQPLQYIQGADQDPESVDEFAGVAEETGARGVLVFQETVDIPANDVPLDENGQPLFLKVHIEGEWEKFRAQAEEEIRSVQRRMTAVLARAAITDHEHKGALLDALGMDRTRDWDDIRNAAAGLRKERDAQAETLELIRNLPEQPEVMDAQHPDPAGYLHGYGVAIRDAKQATYGQQATAGSSDTERSPEE